MSDLEYALAQKALVVPDVTTTDERIDNDRTFRNHNMRDSWHRILLMLVGLVFVLGEISYAEQNPKADAKQHHYFHKKEQPTAIKWGYAGAIGPSRWAELSPAFQLAKTGRRQSPIDLAKPTIQADKPFKLDYHPSTIQLVYNGHTVEEIAGKTSWLTANKRRYQLKQFHFHSPSEHTVNGHRFAMEMHLVHQSADGHVAVIGVLINEGKRNDSFSPVWNHLPSKERTEQKSPEQVDPQAMLPKSRAHFRYLGSFTTPPCTEDVLWLVMSEPVELSGRQIVEFRKIIDGNNRPVQARNGREIVLTK